MAKHGHVFMGLNSIIVDLILNLVYESLHQVVITTLIIAAQQNHIEIVRLLLEAGASMNLQTVNVRAHILHLTSSPFVHA